MPKQDLWIACALALCLSVSVPSFAAAPAENAPSTTVLAVVNGTNLTQADFISFINTRVGEQSRQVNLNQQQMNMLFSEYINRELVYQNAIDKGWDKAPEVVNAIDNHRRNIIARHAFSRLLGEPIAEEDLEKAYKKLRPAREYKTRHILVGSEAEANAVIAALNNGASFETVAKEKSADPSAEQGGDIGWIAAEQLMPTLREALTTLKKGSYSQPIHSDFGWHILRVDDNRIIPVPAYSEVKDDLYRQMQNERIAEYIGELRKASNIEIK